MSTKYYNLSLEEVVHAVHEGKASCETVCSFYLDRIQKYGLRNHFAGIIQVYLCKLKGVVFVDETDKR